MWKTPWVATDDIANLAARELMSPTGQHRVVRQLGADYTMSEIAATAGRELGRPVEYRLVDRTRSDIQAEFLRRFGTLERWLDDSQTMDALNDGRVRFHDNRPFTADFAGSLHSGGMEATLPGGNNNGAASARNTLRVERADGMKLEPPRL